MSTVTEQFYGVKCDYPNCGTVYEGEYSYWADPGDAAQYAEDSDWLINFDGKDYCDVHTKAPDECDYEADHRGYRPLSETFEAQLEVAVDLRLQHTHRLLDIVYRRLQQDLGPEGRRSFMLSTNRKLENIHEDACRAFKPEITNQELFDLKHKKNR